MTNTWPVHEFALWECLEAMEGHAELQASTTESLTLGGGHCQAARAMLWSLFSVLHPQQIVETGTSHGLTSAFLWTLGRNLGYKPRIYTFDLADSTLAPRLWNRLGAAASIIFRRGDSALMIPQTCVKGLEFALIDGDHTYAGAKRDWQAIEPLLNVRSAVFLDNMEHADGCGRFFSELTPLWFHPGMAFLARGLDDAEMQSVFKSYARLEFSQWLRALPTDRGNEIRLHLRELLTLLRQPLADPARRRAADLCRMITNLIGRARPLCRSALTALSAGYNIGTLAAARRQRMVEAIPGCLRPWVIQAYHRLRTRTHD
jgi:predicted O-methyltransferase YrrM